VTYLFYASNPVLRAVIGRLAFAHAYDGRINFDGGALAGGVILETKLRELQTTERLSCGL